MSTETLTNYFKPILYDFHNREALVYRTGFRVIRISYLDLYDRAYRLANWYQHNGLKKGDAVLIWAPNSAEWVAALLACSLTGVIAVPLDMQVKTDFVKHVAFETGAKAGIKSKFMTIASTLPWWDTEDLPYLIRQAPPIFEEPDIRGDDILEIVYTSGTTAAPKGVVLTNRNIVSNIASVTKVFPCDKSWRFLSVLPLSHMFEQTVGLFVPLFHGCSITYLKTRKSAAIVQALQDERITSMVTVPLMLRTLRERILREAAAKGKDRIFNRMLDAAGGLPLGMRRLFFWPVLRKFGKLQFFAVGGAPLEAAVETFWNGLGVKVLQGYGLTETSPIVSCNSLDAPRPNTVGRVLPGQEIKFSEQGEILVRGDNVSPGYYKRPDLTDQCFKDGWYRTGDVGEIDGDGFLHIKGRTKNMILTASGMNVYPEDIEAELNHIPGVKDSCVLSLEHNGNPVIHAVLLLEDRGTEAKSIVEKANMNLADHQKVQAYSVWDKPEFPRTLTMKIQRRFVKQALCEEHGEGGEAAESQAAISPLYEIIRSVSKAPASDMKPEAALGLDLQIDSLSRVELASLIEEKLGVDLDEALVTDKTTIAELENLIASQAKVSFSKLRKWPLSPGALLARRLLQLLFRPLVRYYIRLRVMGREKFDKLDKPFLLIANHVSPLDAAVLTLALPWHVRRRLAVAAAADVFAEWDSQHASFKEKVWRKSATFFAQLGLNIFPFQRYAGIKKSLEYTGRIIDNGWSVMIFPEGRLSHDGAVKQFKSGVGLLVKEMDVPVVPAKIQGIYEIMDYRYKWPRKKGEVTIRFGDPITFSRATSYDEITRRLEHEVRFM
ncbi:MAG: AMP-binding protein [Gammaproteobacteria bacterium]